MDDTTRSTPDGLEPLLGIEELAGYLGVPVATVYGGRVLDIHERDTLSRD